MTDDQWNTLLAATRGEAPRPAPVAFVIDSPWLPGWAGMDILDYFAAEQEWLAANLKVIRAFPEVMFLPGFWSEYGMCTEPSAFGARCLFPENEFPFAEKIIGDLDHIAQLPSPDPRRDGLLPFVIRRLRRARPRIEEAGHRIRFAVARGPLNIASFLMGAPEFLLGMKEEPDAIHRLLDRVTGFLGDWLAYQRDCFPSIDGVMLLDDIIGFIGEADFLEFAQPYFRRLFAGSGAAIRFLHNDAPCRASAPHLADLGVNLFNMGTDIPLAELRELTGGRVALVGNISPRDVLAVGSPEEVARAVAAQRRSLPDPRGVIFSCGGGMSPGVSTENIRAFIEAARAGGPG